jgi:hypothetical protein
MMEQTMSMPWLLGCCCVNLCTARNLLRYQHRIRGNDLIEECGVPTALKCLGDLTQGIFPFVWCLIYGIFVTATMQQLQEVETRRGVGGSSGVALTGVGGGSGVAVTGTNEGRDRYLASPPGAGVMVHHPSSPTFATVTVSAGTATAPSGPHRGGSSTIEFIQPSAVSMTSPFYRTNTSGGYSQVNNPMSVIATPHSPSLAAPPYAIGRPLSEKEI